MKALLTLALFAPLALSQDRFQINPPFGLGSLPPVGAIAFNPPGGYSGPSVLVEITSELASSTVFCTTDGTPANAAATLVGSVGSSGGSLRVTSSATINCTAVQGAVTHQQNQTSQSGWKIVTTKASSTQTGCNGSGSASPASTSGGGTAGMPTGWTYAWGSTATQCVIGPANSSILAVYTGSGNDNATMLVQRKIASATASSSIIQNNEADANLFDATHKVSGNTLYRSGGLQCNQNGSDSGYWEVGGYYAGHQHWAPLNGKNGTPKVTASCPWPANTNVEFAAQGHWSLSDTNSCGGTPCFYYDWVEVQGVRYPLVNAQLYPGYPLNALATGLSGNWGSAITQQDQIDRETSSGQAGRNVTYANVTAATYSTTPVLGSASYTITP